jgi:hypothetical protein
VLIKARVLGLQLFEEIVAQVEFDVARDADKNPALAVEKDALDQGNRDEQTGEEQNAAPGHAVVEPVDGRLQNLGKQNPDGIGGDAGESAPHVPPAVAAHVSEEGGHIAKHFSIVRGERAVCGARQKALLRLDDFEAFYCGKVAHVEGSYFATSFHGCGCNNQIVVADHLASQLQIGPKMCVYLCRQISIRND